MKPTALLSAVSPYGVAGWEARVRIEVFSKTGAGLNAAMMDPSCFRIRLKIDDTLVPPSEDLPFQRLFLGTDALIARTMDLGPALKGLTHQEIEVGWEYGSLAAEPLPLTLFEWPLEEVEAVIETDFGEMRASFYPDKAPLTVANFVSLALDGFYDGLTFHRVVPGFMIQGGCPNGDGTGDPGYFIPGEFSDLSHERGTLSMARSQDPDSAGCQFFIMLADNPGLDGLYASFGCLTTGYETLDRIAQVETTHQRFGDEKSRPVQPVRIKKITISPKQ